MTERAGPLGLHRDTEGIWGELRADFALQRAFWLAFLFGGERPEITELIARTRDLARAEARRVEVISLTGPDAVSDVVVQLLTPHGPEVAATWVIDSGSDVDVRERSWRSMLRRLNERRDVLRAARPAGLIIACPAGLLPMVRDQAPDLWGFRSIAATMDAPYHAPGPDGPPGQESVFDHPNPLSPVAGSSIIATAAAGPLLARAAQALQGGRAADALLAAREVFDHSPAPDDVTLAHAWLAQIRAALDEPTEARRHARTALHDQRPLEEGTTVALLEILTGSPDLDEALLAAAGLVDLHREQVSRLPDSPTALRDLSVALDNVAGVQEQRGELEAALAGYTESLTLARRLVEGFGETPMGLRDLSISLENVAGVEEERGELEAALAGYRESLGLRRRLVEGFGETPTGLRDLSISLGSLGFVQEQLDQVEAARSAFGEARAVTAQLHDRYGPPYWTPALAAYNDDALARLGSASQGRP